MTCKMQALYGHVIQLKCSFIAQMHKPLMNDFATLISFYRTVEHRTSNVATSAGAHHISSAAVRRAKVQL